MYNKTYPKPTRLVWVDLEMTGLDPRVDKIVELAAVITDFDYNELATYEAVIHQPEEALLASNDFSMEVHTANGLYDRVRKSTVTDADVDARFAELIATHVPEGEAYLAGNSIRMDRAFIDAHWPSVSALLHYRMLDVSSFKLWWLGTGHDPYLKNESHRALGDIRESIAELKFYLSELKK